VLEGGRDQLVTGGPAVFAARGALGHDVESTPEAERPALIAARLAKLDNVRWEGTAWVGIAGKPTPTGRINLAGSKEVACAVYAALNDPASPAYSRVRTPSDPATLELLPPGLPDGAVHGGPWRPMVAKTWSKVAKWSR
jgi:hypothetical protein